MKKICIPTDEELYVLKELKTNINSYLTAKMVEKLIFNGINNKEKGMLNSSYKYIKDNYDIAYGVCRLYPEEIKNSEIMQYEPSLCLELISDKNKSNNSNNSLDYLSYFNKSALNNEVVINTVINSLADILKDNPKYRFEYKDNSLLDNIFACNIKPDNLEKGFLLGTIDPIYIARYINLLEKMNIENTFGYVKNKIPDLARIAVYAYAKRYGIYNDNYPSYDEDNAKKLIKCIRK